MKGHRPPLHACTFHRSHAQSHRRHIGFGKMPPSVQIKHRRTAVVSPALPGTPVQSAERLFRWQALPMQT